MKILVTAFGPFKGVPDNSSEALLRDLKTLDWPQDVTLSYHLLDCYWADCARFCNAFLDASEPDLLIHFGSGKPDAFALETVARNRDLSTTPDNAGIGQNGFIIPEADSMLHSPIDWEGVLAELHRHFPLRLSDDAGGFLCNHLYFRSLYHMASKGLPGKVGFVHLPPATDPLSARQLEFARTLLDLLIQREM